MAKRVISGPLFEESWVELDAEVERYRRFMDDVCDMVVEKYDGSLKGEHSTGRNMAPYLEMETIRELVGSRSAQERENLLAHAEVPNFREMRSSLNTLKVVG